MATRIAHFSDTHVLSLKGVQLRDLLNKRLTGAVNLALNRAKHYRVEVFEQTLDAILAVEPDHAICTGDLVNLALQPEFDKVSELLTERFAKDQLTLVPGNHDYYTKEASLAGRFETYFTEYLPQEVVSDGSTQVDEDDQRKEYPVSRLLNEVAIIGLSTAIPTASFMATGEIGGAQLARVSDTLSSDELNERFSLLMLHHPLFPEPNRRLDQTRRLADAEDLIELLDQPSGPKVDLIVHGHNHEFKRMSLPQSQTPVIQVASASRVGSKHKAEFHVYVIDEGKLQSIERHIHSPESGTFIPCDEQGIPLR
jgi:3',5'-cyclic AMP phosphodiesterase CpdA